MKNAVIANQCAHWCGNPPVLPPFFVYRGVFTRDDCEPVRTLLRAKSLLRRLRSGCDKRAQWRGNPPDLPGCTKNGQTP